MKDVSFEVKRGEVVGIIGRNGAGKSTLLKILSRITEPTEGRVTLRGRVASLLEVGTGFHPELTGRENIFLNGAILGMTKAEIKKKFDEIVAFAEVERFLDTPVKRYSSGMYVRLAFAVAAHLEPEILVVDEVLAVGDAEFQKKCLGKMKDVATGGRTVLFVSHNMTVIQSICPKTILLNNGKIETFGQTKKSIDCYLEKNISGMEIKREKNDKPSIVLLRIEEIDCGEKTIIKIKTGIECLKKERISLELILKDNLCNNIAFAALGLLSSSTILELNPGYQEKTFALSLPKMARGIYYLGAQIAFPMVEVLNRIDPGIQFELNPKPNKNETKSLEQNWNYGSFQFDIDEINDK